MDSHLEESLETRVTGDADDLYFCPGCGCRTDEPGLCASCAPDLALCAECGEAFEPEELTEGRCIECRGVIVLLCRGCLSVIDEAQAVNADGRCLRCEQHHNLTVVANLNDMWEDLLS